MKHLKNDTEKEEVISADHQHVYDNTVFGLPKVNIKYDYNSQY